MSLSPATLLTTLLLSPGHLPCQPISLVTHHSGNSSTLHPHQNTDFRIYIDSAVSAPSHSTSLTWAFKAFQNPPHSLAQLRLPRLGHRFSLLGLLMVPEYVPVISASGLLLMPNRKLPFSTPDPVFPTRSSAALYSLPLTSHRCFGSGLTVCFPPPGTSLSVLCVLILKQSEGHIPYF